MVCPETLPLDLEGHMVNGVEAQQDLTKGKAQVRDNNSSLDCLKGSSTTRPVYQN